MNPVDTLRAHFDWRARKHALIVLPILWLAVAVVLAATQGLQVFDVTLPYVYQWDGLMIAMMVQSAVQDPLLPWGKARLGVPFGFESLDFPDSDFLISALVKSLGLFSSDWVVVLGIVYLAGYWLIATSAYVVLRRLGIGVLASACGGLIFAFLPYHFLRTPHYWLALYFGVPLGVWLALWCGRYASDATEVKSFRDWPLGFVLLAVVAAGATGIYYAVFMAYLLGLVAVCSLWRADRLEVFRRTSFALAGVCLVVFVNLVPAIAHRLANGPNPIAASRDVAESELHGLKIAQLVLPSPSHRIEPFAEAARRYSRQAPLVAENAMATLGLAATIGFLILLARALLAVGGHARPDPLLGGLTLFNLGALLLATIGGFGVLVAFFISPQIRAWNRISVVIAFVSLVALILSYGRVADYFAARASNAARSRLIGGAILVGFTAAALYEQSIPIPRLNIANFQSDREFFGRLETMLPRNAMVYQLPFRPYPEAGALHAMEDYGHARGFLHSKTLRWSYPAMKGREGGAWASAVASRPIEQQVAIVQSAGFSAIYVDRRAYADRGATLLQALSRPLGPPALESKDGHLVAFVVPGTAQVRPASLEDVLPFDQPIALDGTALHPLVAKLAGFSAPEPWGRWMVGRTSEITFTRRLPPSFTLIFETGAVSEADVGQRATVKIGRRKHEFVVHPESRYEIPVAGAGSARMIAFAPPARFAPTGAPRIGIRTLRIKPSTQ